MPHPTGPTNPEVRKLIAELRKSKVREYKKVADLLGKSRRSKEGVNLHTLEHIASAGKHNVIVPWKVLGNGNLTKPLRVFSFSFSEGAKEKIRAAGGECHSLIDLLKEEPGHLVVLRDVGQREE